MIYIGIDPDTKKSGVAVWDSKYKYLQLFTMSFFELYDYLYNEKVDRVIIEAGWLNEKSNFHNNAYQTKAAGERISKNVGANHETGRKIAEMCEYLVLNYDLKKPSSSKMTPECFKSMTGIETKNQDKIDAGVLVFGL